MNNPDVSVRAHALNKGTQGMDSIAPSIAQALQVTGSRALNYLHQKLPKPASEMIGDHDYEPSELEQNRWMHLHDIVDDPLSALDHVRHGTITPDHIEALTEVHPELLDDMRQKVMEHMEPTKVRSLSSSTKMALGTFLGSPISESMNPETILGNQVALMANRTPQAPLSSGKDVNLAKRSATSTERLESDG